LRFLVKKDRWGLMDVSINVDELFTIRRQRGKNGLRVYNLLR
jgi:hypothetical protein